ncbi:ArsR/SmtB family transcription factor [Aeromonas caviae]|uniref:ArsR/SmtB family transcription factor n=1 Tax=Aeromonas caviae TaxID=648 RepID=UPI0029D96378|nr:metalloregulator ArsR/SmtB family transcription factor [Aeromonas caviae]MDX7767060.1 metalloregulator ArsR/SmtB family transcription factor [Aeromonas caviae]
MNEMRAAADIAKLLADPLRLSILQFLTWGPCSVAQLVEATRASQPNVSNHLKLLREGSIVAADKQGRQTFYRVASPEIAEVIAALSWAALGPDAAAASSTPVALQEARTCYDHLAGRFGVELMAGLVEAAAITKPDGPWDTIELGPAASKVFRRLGIDIDKALSEGTRRRLAFACPDWSEHRHAHLGGLLGAALCEHCRQQGWIEQERKTRAIRVTPAGQEALGWLLHSHAAVSQIS